MENKTTKTNKSYYLTEQQLIQKYGILFENLKNQQELKSELAEYGYDDKEVAKGKTLYDKALSEYNKNIKEGQEETSAYTAFKQKMDEVTSFYTTDRKKARIVYKNDADVLTNLRLKGRISQAIASMIDDMRVFYTSIQQNSELLSPLKRLKITEDYLAEQLAKLAEVEKAYATYIREKGESQQATKDKNKAFSDIEKWAREFYAIAKIALEDKPQLLESVGKLVRG